ncbi:MAG TPA: DegQ family serine endoprotease [Thermoanaerobaculia bacterium]|nr:DegQ family serine endoprotease [Thermoanaerobaculia bacterium]
MIHTPSRTWILLARAALALVLALGATACDSFEQSVDAQVTRRAEVGEDTPALQARDADRGADLGLARQLSSAFEDVAEAVRPSVVSISTERRPQQRGQGQADPFQESPFGDLFDRFFGPGGRPFDFQMPQPFPPQGLGSGFMVSKDGYILTNAHVVDGADQITVRTTDERELRARLVGSDPQTDLAVLKVENGGLAPLPLGDSDTLRVGQWVVAAGTPFGLSSSITAGIVSATGRSNLRIADYENFIQTDAAINPGNSGGPLLDLDGKVVGINTAIFSRTGGYMGIGFAIPINMAKDVMNSLIEEGKVTRGRLGVSIQDLDDDLAKSFGFQSRDGVLIGDVDPESPAAAAGLQGGDIIVEYDGAPVTRTDDLRMRVAATRPGEAVEVEVFRDGRRRTVEVEIAELTTDQATADRPATQLDQGIGMTVRTLTPEMAAQLGIEGSVRGAVVTQVEPFGPAAKAGIRQGDVIVQVRDAPVTTAEELRRELGKHDLEDGVRVTVLSGGYRRFAVIRAE